LCSESPLGFRCIEYFATRTGFQSDFSTLRRVKRLAVLVACFLQMAFPVAFAQGAAPPVPVRIGLATDASGVFADLDGIAGVDAIRMAVADFGGQVLGRPIEVLFFDHQNKSDLAAFKAREWFDRQDLGLLIGGTNSGTNLAMSKVSQEKRRLMIAVGGATSALTDEQCSPYLVHWSHSTYALARGTAEAVVRNGGKRWYFLQADYAFGEALRTDATPVIQRNGGSVVGVAKHPLGTADFSSFILQAGASQADVLALANAGDDAIRTVRAAKDFGAIPRMQLAALLMFVTDIHELGLLATKGTFLTDSWFWSRDAQTRAWAERFFKKWKRMPTSLQAANYSATWQYLHAVRAAQTTDTSAVLKELKSRRMKDIYLTDGWIRPDGTLVHDMYLLQVKAPEESRAPWDYYKHVGTLVGEAAWRPLAESRCPLWGPGAYSAPTVFR
jgi:branched-chain amino acid transport system substrate-binding protein